MTLPLRTMLERYQTEFFFLRTIIQSNQSPGVAIIELLILLFTAFIFVSVDTKISHLHEGIKKTLL